MNWAGFVESCYVAARSWGHSWQDFLDLPIPMWWLEFDYHVKHSKQVDRSLKEQKIGLGGFTEAEWEDARKAFKRKKSK